ncbi:MAG: OmpA family protein [Phycicoccus sp.]
MGWTRPASAAVLAVGCLLGAGAPALGAPVAAHAPVPRSAWERGTGTDLAEPQRSSSGVEVRTHGTVTVRPYQDAAREPVVMAVHAVQRVDGATVVYYSAGNATTDDLDNGGLSELAARQIGAAYISGGTVGSVRLVDTNGRRAYGTVLEPSSADTAIPSPFASESRVFPEKKGVMGVMYAVLPELPPGVKTVDVDLLFGVTVPDVPVAEGYLQPTADPEGLIPLGTGWPKIDEAEVARIADPARFTYPLATVVEALDDSEVVTDRGETVTVDVAADVLFAFDKADLSAKARAKLAEIAKRLEADGATGTVTIVGHTDDESSDAYNLALSRRRAQAVAAVLTPALNGQSLTFTVEGKGESEPVADNDTDEGRQANRRVTITYTPGGQD